MGSNPVTLSNVSSGALVKQIIKYQIFGYGLLPCFCILCTFPVTCLILKWTNQIIKDGDL